MSRVTNVILTVSAGEDIGEDGKDTVAELLNAAWDTDGCVPWKTAEDSAAGCKHMECGIYLGGFNHMDLAEFIKAIESIPWRYAEEVQLFVMEEEDSRFREVGLWERS
jgi:hypothetical protein